MSGILTMWEHFHRNDMPCARCSVIDDELVCTALDKADKDPITHAMSHTDVQRQMYHRDDV